MDCFDTLILSETWWTYTVGAILWAIVTAIALYWQAELEIKANPLKPWKWLLSLAGFQWRRIVIVSVIAAAGGALVTWGLLTWRITRRHNTYAKAVQDWTLYLVARELPEDSRMQSLKKGDEAAPSELFVKMGKAVCGAFPMLAEKDKIDTEEVEGLEPALRYWLGEEPRSVVVQGHHHGTSERGWAGYLPRVGEDGQISVPRMKWPGGSGELKWSAQIMSCLNQISALTRIVRGDGNPVRNDGGKPVQPDEVKHPVEIDKAEQLRGLRGAISQWLESAAKEIGKGPEDVPLSGCMEFWRAYACVAARYKGEPPPKAEEFVEWADIAQDFIEKRLDGQDGWLYAQMLMQFVESENWQNTKFSPWKVEGGKEATSGLQKGSIELSWRILEGYCQSGEVWQGGDISPQTLAAVIAAEHLYLHYGLGAISDSGRITKEQLLMMGRLKDGILGTAAGSELRLSNLKPEKGLWDDLFEGHGKRLYGLYKTYWKAIGRLSAE